MHIFVVLAMFVFAAEAEKSGIIKTEYTANKTALQ